MALIGSNISPAELSRLKRARWLGRTNIIWLCNEVLGMRDVNREVHGPIIDLMQQFPLPPKDRINKIDVVSPGFVKYRPWNDPYETLTGKRRMLLLDPRGGLKTSINCIAHLIQWILNYPHLGFLVVQANTKKAQDIVREIKQHFQYNQTFRAIYPDYCPQRLISDWGNREEFDVPNEEDRNRLLAELQLSRKEHTVMTASIDKGTAGYHWDVMKFSDIVEENNTRTEDQIETVRYTFQMMENLLVTLDGWIDVEGTRYDLLDLYGRIIKNWNDQPMMRERWKIHVRSCFLRDYGSQKPFYTPDSLQLPFKRDDNNNLVSWWPKRFPLEFLIEQQIADPVVFATQRLNDPIAACGDNMPFPPKLMRLISPEEFRKVPLSHFLITVDTAETVGLRSNASCVTVTAWDRYGRCYVVESKLGKMLPDALIAAIISMYVKYRPTLVRIEETSFVRGLKPSLRRECDIKGFALPLDFIKRENTTTKQERIQNTLQPWYKAGEIIFLDNLEHLNEIRSQMIAFPSKGAPDDFLDTLADAFQNRDWFGRETPRQESGILREHSEQMMYQRGISQWLKIEDPYTEEEYAVPPLPVGSERWKTGC